MIRQIDVCHVLQLAEAIAQELAAVALDLSADLSAAERRALMVLSVGVEDAADRAIGGLPRSSFASALLLRSMLATLANDNAASSPE